jgi:hypothetical protein
VDSTQIRRFRALTPIERLIWREQTGAEVETLRSIALFAGARPFGPALPEARLAPMMISGSLPTLVPMAEPGKVSRPHFSRKKYDNKCNLGAQRAH